MNTTTCARETKTCGQCEYFDAEFGDCLNHYADRFQTEAGSPACPEFFPDTTREGEAECS